MYLIIPANPKNLAERLLWFEAIWARKLSLKDVQLGLEIKGEISYLRKAPNCYFGIHLPNDFATKWYYEPSKRAKLIRKVKKIAKLKPNYVVLHGIRIAYNAPIKDYVQRYAVTSNGNEYLKILRAYIKLVKELKKIVPLKIENVAICEPYFKEGKFLPHTHLYTGTNRLKDLLYIKKKTKVDILLDTEHLAITLNFLNRRKNYQKIPLEKIDHLTKEDKRVQKIFGFYLKKFYIPYLDKKISLKEMIPKIKAKHYHLNGSFQDVIPGQRVVTHGPVSLKSRPFRTILRKVLAQKPEAIVVETADSSLGKTWQYLRKNEQEISFRHMCKILWEEL